MADTRRKATRKKVERNEEYFGPIASIGVVGIIILFGGIMIMSFAHSSQPPASSNYENESAWEESIERTMTVGYLFTMGGIGLLLFMCFTAIFSKEAPHEDKKFFLALSIAITFIFIYIMISFI